jgi:hypothetical protein
MSGLAKRMRDTGEGDIYLAPTSTKLMIDEAADRIEALEKALRSIAANTCCDKCQEAALVARAALEGKDD